MNLKTTIKGKNSDTAATITIQTKADRFSLTSCEQKHHHEQLVNDAHDILRRKYSARNVKIR